MYLVHEHELGMGAGGASSGAVVVVVVCSGGCFGGGALLFFPGRSVEGGQLPAHALVRVVVLGVFPASDIYGVARAAHQGLVINQADVHDQPAPQKPNGPRHERGPVHQDARFFE